MRCIALLIALAVPLSAAAQTTGTIAGTVTSAADGTPIVSAVVRIYNTSGDIVANSLTDGAGAYAIAVAPGAGYNVFAGRSDFAPQLHAGISCEAVDCPRGRGTPVSVTAEATTTVNFSLTSGGVIAGTVRRASGALITAGGNVSAPRVVLYNAAGAFVADMVVGTTGSYAFGSLPAGTYFARTITTQAPTEWLDELYESTTCTNLPGASSCPVVAGTPISVTAGATTAGIDFALDAPGTISGTVTGIGEGVPAGAAVFAYSDGVLVMRATIQSDGSYQIGGLPTGHYTVRTSMEEAQGVNVPPPPSNLVDEWYGDVCFACGGTPFGISVTAGQATSGVDFQLTTGGRITGTVTLGPGPVSPFVSFARAPSVAVYSSTGLLVKTIALNNGAWEAAGLPAGTYYVRTESQTAITQPFGGNNGSGGLYVDTLYDRIPCVAADCLPTRGTPIAVTAGSTTSGINIAPETGALIQGTYPWQSWRSGAVSIYDSRGVRLPRRIGDNLTGTYVAGGLPAGTYFLKMDRDALGTYPASLYKDMPCNGCAVTFGTPVVVTAGEHKLDVNFTALPPQAIRGTVRSSSSAPLSTITVEIFQHNGELAASAVTAADGIYVAPALTPGTYYARTSNTRGFADELYDDRRCSGCDPVLGTPITVTAGADTSGVDFSLDPATRVGGRVTTSMAVPQPPPFVAPTIGVIGGVGIRFTSTTGAPAARVVTDGFGRYETALPPGTYRAQTEPYAGYGQSLERDVLIGSSPLLNVDFFVFQCATRAITPVTLANPAVGVPYRQTLSTVHAPAPLTYSIVSGSLPPGLALNAATGVISGIPTTGGTYTFTVGLADRERCNATRTYTLTVEPCTFTVAPFVSSRASGEPFLLSVSTSCANWTATSNAPWISIRDVIAGPPPAVLIVTDPYTGTAPRVGTITVGPRVVKVFQNGTAPQPPFGLLESPANGQVVSGSIAVSGWALDDLFTSRVVIYRDPVAGEGGSLIYLGDATFVEGARPDVEAAYPTLPGSKRAGWGYLLLTNMLPSGGNGTFNIYAYAIDADGNIVGIGGRTIVVANSAATAPFGAIDTPAQGATVSGENYINFGWALTPQPKLIPFDGSTITVVIDGVPVGPITSYNLFREDVSSLFPGLKNSGGPVGYRVIDTTALSEGVHTIAWVVTDDGGQAQGIGSRYFTVQNSAWTASAALRSRVMPPAFARSEIARADATTAVPPRIDGVDLGRRAASLQTLPVDETGGRTIALSVQQRLELALGPQDPSCGSTYEGYLSANGELRALPVGSSLDRAGTFYWQPGPAFRGNYQLVFVRTSCDGARERLPVTVTI